MPAILEFAALTFVLWCTLRLTLPTQQWEFDFDTSRTTFTLLYTHYTRVVAINIIVSLATSLYGAQHGVPALWVQCSVAGAVMGILFLPWVLMRYEAYLHLRYPRDGSPGTIKYSTSQYAVTLALGFSTLVYTIAGLIAASVYVA